MWTTGKIIEKVNWNNRLFSLRIEADVAPYIAGQFIKLSQQQSDKRVARAYSIVNAPDAPYIEVLAVAVEDGLLSPNLHLLGVGDTIDVSTKAAGFMTLDEVPKGALQGEHLWLLATGTAVGPFMSMLATPEPWQRFKKVVLVYGVRVNEDLAYLNDILALAETYPQQFVFVPCVTREPIANGLQVRIPQGLVDGSIERFANLTIHPDDSQIMICGNPGMITDAQAALIDKGLTKNLRRTPGQITVEKYW